jgi:tetratricopeptide (TPR) repeat protein
LYFRNNLIKEALSAYQTALYITRKIKNKEMEADILGDIGSILDFIDKYDDAIDFFTRALKIYRKIPKRKGKRGEGRTLYDLGLAFFHAKKLEGAQSHLEKSIRLMKKNNDRKGEANCNITLADIHLELKETEIAEKYYKQALKYFQDHKNIFGIINCEIGFGKIQFEQGEFSPAKDRFEEVLRLATEANYLKLQATALLFLSKIYDKLGNVKEAENSSKKANKILKDLGVKLEESS